MVYPSKFKKLEVENGEPAADIVLRLLNEHKSMSKVARLLDMSDAALFRFVEKQKIAKETSWVRSA